MFRPLLLSLTLFAAQSLSLCAHAQAAEQSNMLAFAQPASAAAVSRAAIEQETLQVEQQNHVIPGIAIYAHNFGGDEANRLAQDGVIIGGNSAGNFIDLQSGNVLLNPENNIVVGTPKAKISIAAGAHVFVSESANDLVIYDLLQTKPNQVSIIINKQKLGLEPGRMLVITTQNNNDFDKLDVNCHCVNYRNAASVNLKNTTLKGFMAEFSIASALTTIQPLQRLTVSQHGEDKLALEKLVKGALLLGDFAMSTAQPAQSTQVVTNTTPELANAGNNN